MLFLFRSSPKVKKRIHSKGFRKFWEEPGYKRANLHYCTWRSGTWVRSDMWKSKHLKGHSAPCISYVTFLDQSDIHGNLSVTLRFLDQRDIPGSVSVMSRFLDQRDIPGSLLKISQMMIIIIMLTASYMDVVHPLDGDYHYHHYCIIYGLSSSS